MSKPSLVFRGKQAGQGEGLVTTFSMAKLRPPRTTSGDSGRAGVVCRRCSTLSVGSLILITRPIVSMNASGKRCSPGHRSGRGDE